MTPRPLPQITVPHSGATQSPIGTGIGTAQHHVFKVGMEVALGLTIMPSPHLLSHLRHTPIHRVCLAITLGIATTAGCAPEPCQSIENVPVSLQTTPFSDGASVYSKCSACPELPKMDGVDASGPATVCQIGFGDGGSEMASVECFYGPGGNTASSISNGAVTDVPNLFDFCEAHCPDHDALHACSLSADENGVQQFICLYGRICG